MIYGTDSAIEINNLLNGKERLKCFLKKNKETNKIETSELVQLIAEPIAPYFSVKITFNNIPITAPIKLKITIHLESFTAIKNC